MPSPAALLLGLLVASPALHGALVAHTISVDAALTRVLLVLVGISLGFSALESLWRSYTAQRPAPGQAAEPGAPTDAGEPRRGRRRGD